MKIGSEVKIRGTDFTGSVLRVDNRTVTIQIETHDARFDLIATARMDSVELVKDDVPNPVSGLKNWDI